MSQTAHAPISGVKPITDAEILAVEEHATDMSNGISDHSRELLLALVSRIRAEQSRSRDDLYPGENWMDREARIAQYGGREKVSQTSIERHDHWRVTVETSGEHIVSIEPEMLAGREPSEADYDAIRTAAHHLLSFAGDPQPAALASLSHTMGVKGLEWWEPDHTNNYTHGAKTIIGTYYVHIDGGRHIGCMETFVNDKIEQWDGPERGHLYQAQQDCQSDFDQRIRSALTPTQQPEPVGWFVRMETAKKVIWHSQDSREDAERYAKSHSTYGGKAMQLYAAPPARAALNAEVSK